jgi:hypothetical protein
MASAQVMSCSVSPMTKNRSSAIGPARRASSTARRAIDARVPVSSAKAPSGK